MLDYMMRDFPGFLRLMLYRAPAVLLALTLHEWAHGYVALRSGDRTAQALGRLSVNPLRHLDPVGTFFLFFFGVGWAKPVPVNPNNFRNGVKDDLKVSLAGVTLNFLLFLLTLVIAVLLAGQLYKPEYLKALGYPYFLGYDQEGFQLALFPAYTDLLTIALKTPWLLVVQRFLYHFLMINLGLSLFNMLPFPPLDGFHVFNDIIFRGRLNLSSNAFRIAQMALMIIVFSTDILGKWISSAMGFIQSGVLTGLVRLLGLA